VLGVSVFFFRNACYKNNNNNNNNNSDNNKSVVRMATESEGEVGLMTFIIILKLKQCLTQYIYWVW